MDYKEHIGHAIEYIEANLGAGLSLADLARAAGYSEYHFLRVFKQVTRVTPADYIRKRRISEVARKMDAGGRSLSDIAFEYGFNSKENFTRAFKVEHGVLPTQYRAAGNSLKLYGRLPLATAPFEAAPEVVTLGRFALAVYPGGEETPPKFWNRYNCKKLSLRLSGGKTVADFGVCTWDENGRMVYSIGIRADEAAGDTAEAKRLEIPGGMYAMVATPPASHFDFVNTIHRTWNYLLNTWMPQSGYAIVPGPQFETYVEASRTYSEEIYVPVMKKEHPPAAGPAL